MMNRMAPYLFLGCLILTLLALGCGEAPPPVVEAPVEEAPAEENLVEEAGADKTVSDDAGDGSGEEKE